MPHTVKLEDEVYDRLGNFRGKNETYSQAVDRLLKVSDTITKVVDEINEQLKFSIWQREQIEKARQAVGP